MREYSERKMEKLYIYIYLWVKGMRTSVLSVCVMLWGKAVLSDEERKTAVLLTATELKSQGSLSKHDEGIRESLI